MELHEAILRRDSLKLPTRAQSLNYPKSPKSPRISSPSPVEFPRELTLSLSLFFSISLSLSLSLSLLFYKIYGILQLSILEHGLHQQWAILKDSQLEEGNQIILIT